MDEDSGLVKEYCVVCKRATKDLYDVIICSSRSHPSCMFGTKCSTTNHKGTRCTVYCNECFFYDHSVPTPGLVVESNDEGRVNNISNDHRIDEYVAGSDIGEQGLLKYDNHDKSDEDQGKEERRNLERQEEGGIISFEPLLKVLVGNPSKFDHISYDSKRDYYEEKQDGHQEREENRISTTTKMKKYFKNCMDNQIRAIQNEIISIDRQIQALEKRNKSSCKRRKSSTINNEQRRKEINA